jgi:hypothetical protein
MSIKNTTTYDVRNQNPRESSIYCISIVVLFLTLVDILLYLVHPEMVFNLYLWVVAYRFIFEWKFKNIRTGFNFSKPSFPVWRQNIFAQFSETQIKRTFPIIQYIIIWNKLFWFFSNLGLVLSTIRFFGETYSDDFVPFFYTIVLYIRFRLNKSDKVCQWFVTGRWFSLGTPDFFTNKTDKTRYNWHIVENGVKHHNSNQTKRLQEYLWLCGTTIILIHTLREFIFSTRYRTFLRPVFTYITFPLKAEKCTLHRIKFS